MSAPHPQPSLTQPGSLVFREAAGAEVPPGPVYVVVSLRHQEMVAHPGRVQVIQEQFLGTQRMQNKEEDSQHYNKSHNFYSSQMYEELDLLGN